MTRSVSPHFLLASLSDWSEVGGLAIAVVGVALVVAQLRGGAAAARAQATMQFQAAFKASGPARARLLKSFPMHTEMLTRLSGDGDRERWAVWTDLRDVDEAHVADAEAVVNALNDVAQYVADGLSLRSALQQYHTIFIRAGVLLCPYIDERNQHGAARWGRRIPILYNVALDYHRLHPKHSGLLIALKRDAVDGSGEMELTLCDHGSAPPRHQGFPGDSPLRRRFGRKTLRSVIRTAERELRR